MRVQTNSNLARQSETTNSPTGLIDSLDVQFLSNQRWPQHLSPGEVCEFNLETPALEIDGIKLIIDFESDEILTRNVMLRIIADSSYLCELLLNGSGQYVISGALPTNKKVNLQIGLTVLWPFNDCPVVKLNAVSALPPSGQLSESDWTPIIGSRESHHKNCKRILRSVDPLGITLNFGPKHVRLIRKQSLDTWAEFRESIAADVLVRSGLVAHSISEATNWKLFPEKIITESGWGLELGNPTESQIKNVLNVWIQIDKTLSTSLDAPWGLIDFNFSNFGSFQTGTWKLIDHGSIQPLPNFSTGIEQVIRYGLPLLKLSLGSINESRMFDQYSWSTSTGDNTVGGSSSIEDILSWLQLDLRIPESFSDRDHARSLILDWIAAQTTESRSDFWADYDPGFAKHLQAWRTNHSSGLFEQSRDSVLMSLVGSLDRGSLLDLGCAGGRYSAMASILGHQVVALDGSAVHIEQIFQEAKLFPDISISPRHFVVEPDSLARLSGTGTFDTTLCLAITHHLLLAQHSPIPREPVRTDVFCDFIGEITNRYALIEFMPLGLGSVGNSFRPVPDPLPADYSLESFCDSLSEHFQEIHIISYDESRHRHRQLLVCFKSP